MDARLAEVRFSPFSDEPRFYPPGRHPAITRHVRLLAFLETIGGAETDVADYLRGEIAAFEQGESEAKQQVLRKLDSRRR